MPQSSTINAKGTYAVSKTADFQSVSQQPFTIGKTYTFENGTSDNQCDLQYTDQITIAASGSQNLDLSGALTNSIGDTVVFAKVRAIQIYAAAANTNDVIVGNVSNGITTPLGAATHSFAVRPDGTAIFVSPKGTSFPVVAGTGDLLKLANGGSGTSVTFDIAILGCSV
jgi:hypothetical protein